jgi:hypothetical protein
MKVQAHALQIGENRWFAHKSKRGHNTYPFSGAHRAITLLEVYALLSSLALELLATEELVVLGVAILGL